jgi:hypothetical protein
MVTGVARPPRPKAQVTVRYISAGGMASKTFTDIYAARRFYATQFRAGNRPVIEVGVNNFAHQ